MHVIYLCCHCFPFPFLPTAGEASENKQQANHDPHLVVLQCDHKRVDWLLRFYVAQTMGCTCTNARHIQTKVGWTNRTRTSSFFQTFIWLSMNLIHSFRISWNCLSWVVICRFAVFQSYFSIFCILFKNNMKSKDHCYCHHSKDPHSEDSVAVICFVSIAVWLNSSVFVIVVRLLFCCWPSSHFLWQTGAGIHIY